MVYFLYRSIFVQAQACVAQMIFYKELVGVAASSYIQLPFLIQNIFQRTLVVNKITQILQIISIWQTVFLFYSCGIVGVFNIGIAVFKIDSGKKINPLTFLVQMGYVLPFYFLL
jgi:hypothetical protein